MIFFITVLRAIAACLITNAHYTGIYPTDLIANGGLLGDILFFAVSGYCLCDLKMNFIQWYSKRIYRIYIPVWIVTSIYILCGVYQLSERSIVGWYLYPTGYHFIASIIVLYIPFYFIMKMDCLKRNISRLMIAIAVLWFVLYVLIYDKSYYHIDTVREPFIRFLFMEAMLLGAWFKQNDKKIRNQFKLRYPVMTVITFVGYFASKLLFARNEGLAQLQFINQVVIFMLLYFIFRTFCALDEPLEKLPEFIKKNIKFISNVTLEIYLVQYVLIDLIRPLGYFPVNWIVLTSAIVATAWLLHQVCQIAYHLLDGCFKIILTKKRG